MNCDLARTEMIAYLQGELPAEQKTALEEHLAGCPDCRVQLEEARRHLELLAAAILSSQGSDPVSAKGCLDQVSHGPESLKSPEPGFYVLGAKSYGRNPNFLLALGHQQIEDVMTLLGAAEKHLNAATR